MINALVSIITPCYNSEKYIKQMIQSVQIQSYINWELIIVDDASTDKSYLIIAEYMKTDTRIKCIQNIKNIGVSKSRNKAIEEAKGEYIAFLDADDIWLEHKLRKQLSFMQKNNILLSYTAYYTMGQDGQILKYFKVPSKVNYTDMLKTSTIGTLTTIYNAKKLKKFYMQTIGHEDYIMKLEILKKIPYAKGINEPLAHYRIYKKSLSSNKLRTAKWQWHIYRNIEKISFIRSVYYFLHYTYNGFFKYK